MQSSVSSQRPRIFEQFDLSGKTALITGGSKGIGKNIALALAEAGAKVMIAARGRDDLEAAKEEIAAVGGPNPEIATVDLVDRSSTEQLAATALDALGHVDILIPNAAIERGEFVDTITDGALDEVLEANFSSCVILTRNLVAQMKERGWGRIIYLSSATTAVASADGHSIYCATKAALEAFARTAAIELGTFGITVNSLAPGTFYTDMAKDNMDQLGPDLAEATYQAFAQMNAFNRWGNTSELEGAALLLASDAGSYITGTVMRVDGGLSFKMRPMP